MTTNILTRKKTSVHPCKNECHDDVVETRIFGFWVYLMTDCILFCCLFITYSVLIDNTSGGPTGKEIFNLKFVLVETILLLFSSFTYGVSIISMKKNSDSCVIFWMLLTWLFGISFIGMEIYEMYHLVIKNISLDRSGFLSAFFALIGTHALHVVFGLIWMIILMYQIIRRNLTKINRIRIICLSLFWHFLDIVWICIFSFIYLIGIL